jgi:hypothetical protein
MRTIFETGLPAKNSAFMGRTVPIHGVHRMIGQAQTAPAPVAGAVLDTGTLLKSLQAADQQYAAITQFAQSNAYVQTLGVDVQRFTDLWNQVGGVADNVQTIEQNLNSSTGQTNITTGDAADINTYINGLNTLYSIMQQHVQGGVQPTQVATTPALTAPIQQAQAAASSPISTAPGAAPATAKPTVQVTNPTISTPVLVAGGVVGVGLLIAGIAALVRH